MTTLSVHDYVKDTFAPDIPAIPEDYDLVDGGIIDSLALVRLLAWVGETFTIPIEEIDVDPTEFRTIEGIRRFIDRNSLTSAKA